MTKAVKKFTRKLLKSEKATDIISWIINSYLKFVGHTTHWNIEGLESMNKTWDKEGSMIILSWHGRAGLIPYFWNKRHPLHALVSEHKDGQLMGKIIKRYGLGLIDGSTTSNASRAAVKLMKTLQNGESICLTPDGPIGPSMHMNLSPLIFAQKSGKPIVGMTYSIKHSFILRKSWDEMMFPLPFSKGSLVVTKPFFIPENSSIEDLERYRQEIENEFVSASIQADKNVGRSPILPGTKVKKKKQQFIIK